ncbi:MAG: NAD-dependent epimerase/dehydratase family protein [Phaeodactylibacter sp.]|nr:NAD-dependent epimerase/dehydratase family protein [Phaeodactylibacter sp.]MCB9273223.1 NAD-dependent epimerase/dehydratase family protein [Lewinellaceae bacterium]
MTTASPSKNIPILVTGATGFVGAYLLQHLACEGYTNIRALRQPGSDMSLVETIATGIEWVEGDLLDLSTLEEAMQGIRRVFHCAAIVSFDPADRQRMLETNVEGTANVVNAALYRGIEKLVHVSSVAALGRIREGATLDENAKWQRSRFNTNYALSKFLGEQEVWRGIAEGLQAAIVNPAIILGSGYWDKGSARLFKLVAGNYPFYPGGTTSLVDVRDVARFMALLMDSDITGQRFILSAESWPYRKLLEAIAQELGARPPGIRATLLMSALTWRLAWLAGFLRRKPPLLTRETAMNSNLTFYYDNRKSIEAFGFHYTPIRQVVAETARQYLEAGREGFPPMLLPLTDNAQAR